MNSNCKRVVNCQLTIINHQSHGFTAVELLVAMALVGLIVGFSYKGYLFFQKNFIHWQERVSMEETGRRIINALINDLQTMRKVIEAEENSITFVDFERKIVTYSFKDQGVFKNGRQLLNEDLTVAKLQFSYFTSNDDSFNFIDNKMNIEKIQIHLLVKNKRRASFELISAVTLRNKRLF